jgi:type I restriction enzyme M protein
MTRKQQAQTQAQPTTAQQLGSLVKSARDIMRKDKGLSGDLDRLPMLTWIMFLKFLDDLEQIEESRAKLGKTRYRSSIEPPYRWRDWAAKEDGVTGPELLAFIQHEECTRPDGTKGPGLFAYLRNLGNGNGRGTAVSRRRVIATVFSGVQNRMTSGYLLRDVINKVNGIHFLAKDELFTLGSLYESMLKEMRDAAGDNGEFYTPRAVVRFMVTVLDPQLAETILDPACGTGGFLVETFAHLEKQCQTVQHRRTLRDESIFGGEAKPLPYLLCQMNLLLHGLEAPNIDPLNSLRHRLSEIGDKDRVDIILTNPPFGGEEERGILGNFPEDKQTAETALLFLQLIMRKLRRPGTPVGGPGGAGVSAVGRAGVSPASRGGRAGVVVPNGTLFGDGVCARIKAELLREFNLHTIVRLPNGVFAPYTSIPTNLLFFDRSGPTKDIWYYEQPLPEGRKNYTKTQPLQFEEFADCLKWWPKRKENDRAWKVKAADVLKTDTDGAVVSVNLDIKNPRGAPDLEHLPPEQLVEDILAKEQRIVEIMGEIKGVLAQGVNR